MNYCPKCGNPVNAEDRFCAKCGSDLAGSNAAGNNTTGAYTASYSAPKTVEYHFNTQSGPAPIQRDNVMTGITKAFMILGCISLGWLILPLAWCIPMTVSYFHKVDRGEPISTGFKVCSLLFVNVIAGIMMLCAEDS